MPPISIRLNLASLITLILTLLFPLIVFGEFDCTITQFTAGGAGASFDGGVLSASSPWITYAGSGFTSLGSSFEVFRANILTGEMQNVTNVDGYDGNPTISSDGTRIAFESETNLAGGNPDGNREIVWLDVVTNQFLQLTDSTGTNNFRPKINNTGTRVVFRSSNDLVGENPQEASQAFLYDINRASLVQLTHLESGLFGVGMNSMATLVTFGSTEDLVGENPEGNREVFLLNIETGGLTQITHTLAGDSDGASISDNGERIVFRSDSEDLIGSNPDGLSEVVFHDRSKGSFTQLSNVNPNSIGARVTPDGKRVLMNLSSNVIIHDLSSGVQEVLVAAPGINGYSSTSPDGNLISIRSNRDLTGENPDSSFEIFLAACGFSLFTDGFEGGDTSAWSTTFEP